MATAHSQNIARWMVSPSVVLLFLWMIIPLGMTLWFSVLRYVLINPGPTPFIGTENYYYFLTDPSFTAALVNTLVLVGSVLVITIVGGTLLALLIDQPIWGQGIVRLLVISPFFIMPTVSALVWKNMFMNPVNGLFAHAAKFIGVAPIDFFAHIPLASIILMVSWQWLPFATLILLTALQSLDQEQLEAAEIDGASPVNRFFYMVVPHLARAATVVVLIQTIFLLSIFAEIFVTTNGGPGSATTNITYLVFQQMSLYNDVGSGTAGGIVAVVLANIVAIVLMYMIGKNLDV